MTDSFVSGTSTPAQDAVEELVIGDAVLNYKDADTTITPPRPAGKAWVGVKFAQPESFSFYAETAQVSINGKAFQKISNNSPEIDFHDETYFEFLGLTVDKVEAAIEANQNPTWTFAFDLNGDGTAEQTITVIVDLHNVTINYEENKYEWEKNPQIKVVEGEIVDKNEYFAVNYWADNEKTTKFDYQSIRYNATTTAAATTPTKEGYTFNSWVNADGTAFDFNTKIKADTDIFAKWNDPNIYTITYELNGGVNNPDNPTEYTIESEDITIKAPTKAGYTFSGWSFTEDGTVYSVLPNPIKGTDKANYTLYAHWISNTIVANKYIAGDFEGAFATPDNATEKLTIKNAVINFSTKDNTIDRPAGYAWVGVAFTMPQSWESLKDNAQDRKSVV